LSYDEKIRYLFKYHHNKPEDARKEADRLWKEETNTDYDKSDIDLLIERTKQSKFTRGMEF
jgi:hypothetical protein